MQDDNRRAVATIKHMALAPFNQKAVTGIRCPADRAVGKLMSYDCHGGAGTRGRGLRLFKSPFSREC
jgi:hypothetical protein